MTDLEELRKKRANERIRRAKRFKRLTAVLLVLIALNIGLGLFNIIKAVQLSKAEPEVIYLSDPSGSGKNVSSPAEQQTVPEGASSKENSISPSETESTGPQKPAAAYKEQSYERFERIGIIKNVANYLNIRKTPDVNSACVGKAMLHTAFTITGEEGDWYAIESNGFAGYVSKQYVATGEEAKSLAVDCCEYKARVVTGDCAFYKEMSEESAVLFNPRENIRYDIVEDDLQDSDGNYWVRVTIMPGADGYVPADEVQCSYFLEEPFFFTGYEGLSDIRLQLVNYAFEWYGGEYVWGGTTLGKGVDCSGYVMRVYEHYGIRLPRNSYYQCNVGTGVGSIEELLPGDLLFYRGFHDGSPSEGVGHVTIYIGNGKMIHAASEARGIVVDEWDFMGPPLAITRVIDDDKYQGEVRTYASTAYE